MSVLILFLATGLGLCSAVGFYLCARSQRLLESPLSLKAALSIGSVLALAALVLFLQVSGPAASVFILLTLITGTWTGLPFLMAVLKPIRRSRP